MDIRTGRTFESFDEALKAGVPASDIAHVEQRLDELPVVTFKNGPPSKPEGKMVEGDVAKLQCGMRFHVTPTSKS